MWAKKRVFLSCLCVVHVVICYRAIKNSHRGLCNQVFPVILSSSRMNRLSCYELLLKVWICWAPLHSVHSHWLKAHVARSLTVFSWFLITSKESESSYFPWCADAYVLKEELCNVFERQTYRENVRERERELLLLPIYSPKDHNDWVWPNQSQEPDITGLPHDCKGPTHLYLSCWFLRFIIRELHHRRRRIQDSKWHPNGMMVL